MTLMQLCMVESAQLKHLLSLDYALYPVRR